MRKVKTKNKLNPVLTLMLIATPLLLVFVSLFFGRYSVSPANVCSALLRPGSVSPAVLTVVRQLRLPRAIAAAFVGASLSVSGAAFQSIFRNPLVNSGILGVSNGAGFGACLAIVFLGGGLTVYFSSFAFALLAVVLSWFAGRVSKVTSTVSLILGGAMVSAFFSALISIMKFLADPYSQLPGITFWLMGSFASINYSHLTAVIPMALGILAVFLSRWKINVLSMGDKEAASLGVDVRKYKLLVITGATVATASAVCISGTIGWVGLVIPHIGRMLIGNNNSKLIPVSISLGACFMIVMDLIARSLTSSELPIGILCAVIGSPFFVYLLKKKKGGTVS
ncbi:MAG: iron ABC transporter permease [Clostridia bacterium]|nr:iron ABC transporter permease [Clostridia bacterium]